jgi:predicted transcriptional regulator
MEFREPKVVVSAQIEREQRAELERMAHDDDRTVSALVRRAVGEFIEREQHIPSGESAVGFAKGPAADTSEHR